MTGQNTRQLDKTTTGQNKNTKQLDKTLRTNGQNTERPLDKTLDIW